jgi:hypothetical protein
MKLSGKIASLVLAGSMALVSVAAQASGPARGIGGSIACGDNNFNRLGGSEAHRSSWVLRNIGDTSVRIEQMSLFDANGNVLFSADGASLPVFRNNVIGPGDNIIDANQTAQILSQDILGDGGLDRNARPITMKFDWASDSKTRAPGIGSVRFVRERITSVDPVTGTATSSLGKERSRHQRGCHNVSINKGRHID